MKKITKYAKEHRHNLTSAEKELKKKLFKWGIRFRSQRQFDYYIVDFLIPDRRLVIEVDGKYHNTNVAYDIKRQKYIEKLGLRFIRVDNDYVLKSDCEELRGQILSYEIVDIKGIPMRYSYGLSKI